MNRYQVKLGATSQDLLSKIKSCWRNTGRTSSLSERRNEWRRLAVLSSHGQSNGKSAVPSHGQPNVGGTSASATEIGESQNQSIQEVLGLMSDRLGRSGLWTSRQRSRFYLSLVVVFALWCLVLASVGYYGGLSRAQCLAVIFVLVYCLILVAYFGLRWSEVRFEQRVLFYLPITLESLILLVESGLGVLPAIQSIVRCDVSKQGVLPDAMVRSRTAKNNTGMDHTGMDHSGKNHSGKFEDYKSSSRGADNPVSYVMSLAYLLSQAGLPFSKALYMVADAVPIKALKHVLLHLDIALSDGGELIPSLRNLSEHCHTEWKLSIEARVRRLESLSVFPVFFSLLGLILIATAVPMVPIVDFVRSLGNSQTEQSDIAFRNAGVERQNNMQHILSGDGVGTARE